MTNPSLESLAEVLLDAIKPNSPLADRIVAQLRPLSSVKQLWVKPEIHDGRPCQMCEDKDAGERLFKLAQETEIKFMLCPACFQKFGYIGRGWFAKGIRIMMDQAETKIMKLSFFVDHHNCLAEFSGEPEKLLDFAFCMIQHMKEISDLLQKAVIKINGKD